MAESYEDLETIVANKFNGRSLQARIMTHIQGLLIEQNYKEEENPGDSLFLLAYLIEKNVSETPLS